MPQTAVAIAAQPPFHFAHSAYSHGWVVLAPTAWDAERKAVRRVEHLSTGRVVLLDITGSGRPDAPTLAVQITHDGPLSDAEVHEIVDNVSHMFRIDEDFADFYALCCARGGRWERVTQGLGRLLRSPTLFEDVVKTICTTNIQWGGTKRMINELVATFGAPYPSDGTLRAFPTPEAIAAATREEFTNAVRMGYRGPYVHELAQRTAGGMYDLEALRHANLPTPTLKKELLAIKGVGSYSAATLLMLLGRYDEIGVDTIFREFVARHYFGGERRSDAEALAVYDTWGEWKYLAYWFDIWADEDEAV